MAAPSPIDWKSAFLAALRVVPVVASACEAAGVVTSTAYRAREADALFAEAWAEAMRDGIDAAEAEAFRRGVYGYEEPVFHQGQLVPRLVEKRNAQGKVVIDRKTGGPKLVPLQGEDGQVVPLTVRKHSDRLLEVVLKGRRRYVDRLEQTGADGGPIAVQEAQRAMRVAALMEIARRRKSEQEAGGE